MNNTVTIQVSEPVARFAAQLATKKHQPYEQVLSQLLDETVPVEILPDQQLLALSEAKLPEEQDERLSELLAQQRETLLDEAGRQELNDLMRLYEHGLLRKAQALRVAVERGLREPLRF